MWCTRWFLPLLLLPLPIAPPYFLVLFLLALALHASPCFYCILLLAALFLSSCYWQSFPLDARLSGPWPSNSNIITFSDAFHATLPSHLSTLDVTPPTIRVADRCWCDFASGMFEPYDVQQWEMDSIQRAVAQIDKQLKESLEPENANATVPPPVETQQAPNVATIRNETLTSILLSFFSRRSNKSEPTESSIPPTNAPQPSETTSQPPVLQPSLLPEPLLAPGQLDMRPFGFELILDLRWSRRS